jgi:hypothetical protein
MLLIPDVGTAVVDYVALLLLLLPLVLLLVVLYAANPLPLTAPHQCT